MYDDRQNQAQHRKEQGAKLCDDQLRKQRVTDPRLQYQVHIVLLLALNGEQAFLRHTATTARIQSTCSYFQSRKAGRRRWLSVFSLLKIYCYVLILFCIYYDWLWLLGGQVSLGTTFRSSAFILHILRTFSRLVSWCLIL